jgi:hypothetical protein
VIERRGEREMNRVPKFKVPKLFNPETLKHA